MKQFTYTITDPVGVHARPAGLLAKAAKGLNSTVTITKADGSKSAAATKLMALMGMGIKTGETVTVTVEGGDEEANARLYQEAAAWIEASPVLEPDVRPGHLSMGHIITPPEIIAAQGWAQMEAFIPVKLKKE